MPRWNASRKGFRPRDLIAMFQPIINEKDIWSLMNTTDPHIVHEGLNRHLASGRSLIMVETYEEDRLQALLEELARKNNKPFWIWKSSTGLVGPEGTVNGTREPGAALSALSALPEAPVAWLADIHHHFQPTVTRALRDLYYNWRDKGGFAVMSGTGSILPKDIEREVAVTHLPLPSQSELKNEAAQWLEKWGDDAPDLDPEIIGATMRGLTLSEFRHGLTRLKNQKPDQKRALLVLQEEKRQLINKMGTLEYIPEVPALHELGGLENLKSWLLERKELLVSDDETLKEIAPKGVMLMGVSGCGKSLCIKAVSSAWQLPLYRMEMVRIFSGGYGSPEHAFAEACHLMEEMAPAVLWLDEIEMSLSAGGSTAADSVMSRIFAFFLTWMQEKPPGLFVAATANRIDLLPAEMIRKGRFDQVFFVDLPTTSEREQIFRIHLQRRGCDPDKYTPEVFADASEGWNGAEIEQCVVAAVTAARMERRELTLKDMHAARKQIVPISTTMEEQVRHIRNWAYERAVRASASE